VPSVVPAPLASIAQRLQCPVCAQRLAPAPGSLICPHRHSFDVAREGYVTLQRPSRRPATGDDAGMVAARAAVQQAGHFRPLTGALNEEARRVGGGNPLLLLDAGAGTAHHLAGILDVLVDSRGIALDASRDAMRHAARAHPRIAAVRGDVWQHVPLGDATVDLALSAFAPRNGPELARVLRPGGELIVVTPTQGHLAELAPLHSVGVDPRKHERLVRQLAPALRPIHFRRVAWTLRLTAREAEALLRMGPARYHLRPELEGHLAGTPEPIVVTATVELRTFRPSGARTGYVSARRGRHSSCSALRSAPRHPPASPR
jgi:23S rRNA (guanine745-N1)-methyltransferase